MFVDSAKVSVQAGRGGSGRVSFRTEKYVDKGGPDGGDGGRGGNVVFQADTGVNTLVDFRIKKVLAASDGQPGGERKKHGRNGEDIVIKVPVGTQIYRDDELITDLVENQQSAVIAKGGDGGFGNAHFKSSTRQAPRIAEVGEPGEAFEARLELKLLADVGLVGFPNAGKSTFLSVVTSAKPAIADYAFTTLEPNLGVADIDDTSLLIADIPGLIEGASEGKGLGDAFLRHVERTAVVLHLIDAYSEDPAKAYQTIRGELAAYSTDLTKLPEVVVLSKTDGLDAEMIEDQLSKLKRVVSHMRIYAMSAVAKAGLQEVLRALVTEVAKKRAQEAEEAASKAAEQTKSDSTIALSEQQLSDAWRVVRQGEAYIVTGNKIERFALRTDYTNPHSLNRLRDIMKKMGVTHELLRQNAQPDSIIIIVNNRFTLAEVA